jgi:alpha-tubulin suppressor-like RCC1 family protein
MQLGLITKGDYLDTPQQNKLLSNIIQVSAGGDQNYGHSLALNSFGKVYVFGANNVIFF